MTRRIGLITLAGVFLAGPFAKGTEITFAMLKCGILLPVCAG